VTGSSTVDYVEMLAGLEHNRQQPQFVMAANNGVLVNRIRRLLAPQSTKQSGGKSSLLILCMALVVTTAFWFAPKVVSAQTSVENIDLEIYDAEGVLLDELIAPHAFQMIRDEVIEKLSSGDLKKNLKVYSSINMKAQQAAYDAALNAQMLGLNSQLALVSIEPSSGGILALIGEHPDIDSTTIDKNRAITLRQVGSAIKPFIYATAFEEAGFSQATLLKDEPINVLDYSGEAYPLNNHDRQFIGKATIRHHLNISRNVPPIKLLDESISADSVISNLKALGYINPIDKITLSTFDTQASPLQVTGAYASFANSGVYTAPFIINRIEDANGKQLFEHEQSQTRVWTEQTAYEMLDALNGNVIDLKNGYTSFSSRADISGHWVGGKTGTSNNGEDIWFAGITPGLVTTVWMGFDNHQSIPKRMPSGDRITSSRQPNYFWHDYTVEALDALNIDSTIFPIPEGIEFKSINLVTGKEDEMGIITALPTGSVLTNLPKIENMQFSPPFDNPSMVVYGENGSVIGIRAQEINSPVRSVLAGKITDIRLLTANSGYMVTIQHREDIFSTYQNLQKPSVNLDDTIEQGTIIGYLGGSSLMPEDILPFRLGNYKENGEMVWVDSSKYLGLR